MSEQLLERTKGGFLEKSTLAFKTPSDLMFAAQVVGHHFLTRAVMRTRQRSKHRDLHFDFYHEVVFILTGALGSSRDIQESPASGSPLHPALLPYHPTSRATQTSPEYFTARRQK